MILKLNYTHILKLWRILGLAPIAINKTYVNGKMITFSKFAFLQTVFIFTVTMMSHAHYIWGNWTDFKKKSFYLSRPLQIVARLVSSCFMTMTNAVFLLSSPILASKFIKLNIYLRAIEDKLKIDRHQESKRNLLIIYFYCFYIFHILFHFFACLILLEWKQIEELNSIVLMYLNDFVILAGGSRWFYIVYNLKIHFQQLNKVMKRTITWKHSYIKDFSAFEKKGLALIAITRKNNKAIISFTKQTFVYSIIILALTIIGHAQYIVENWNSFNEKRYDNFSKHFQFVPRLANSLFMMAADIAFLLSSKKITIKLINKLPQLEWINEKLPTTDSQANLFVMFCYCFFFTHISLHLTACIILIGWLDIIALNSIILMSLNDLIILAGGLRWFFIVYHIQDKFSRLNKVLELSIRFKYYYDKDCSISNINGLYLTKTENFQTEAVQELLWLHMSLKELSDYIVSLFGPEILIYTIYLIAEIILVQYDVIVMIYVVSELRPQSYPYYISRVIKLLLRFIEVFYLTWPCHLASTQYKEIINVLFSNRAYLNKQTTSRVKIFLNHYEKLKFDICGFFTLSLHTIMAILSLATSYLVIAVQFMK